MLLVATSSFCISRHRMRLIPPSVSSSTVAPSLKKPENQQTVSSLYDLSVDIPILRKLKGWILTQSTAHVSQTAHLLRDMGADASSRLTLKPSCVAQRDLWESVCPGKT